MNSISPIANHINIIGSAELPYTSALQFHVITKVMDSPKNIPGDSIKDIFKKYTDSKNENSKSYHVYPIKTILKIPFTDSKFNNIPRNKRSKSTHSKVIGSKPRSVSSPTEKIDRIKTRSDFMLANQLEQSPALTEHLADEGSQRLEKNAFYPGIFADTKARLTNILKSLQISPADKQWEELAKALKNLNRYQYKASLDHNVWQDTFKSIFEAISQNRITTKSQFDAFNEWVNLVDDDTPLGLENNPNQANIYLTRLHEILTSPNKAIQEEIQENANTLFSYRFFKKLSVSEYEGLKGKLIDVIRESFNISEKLGEKKHYYFIRNMLLSYKSLIQSAENFVLREDVLRVLESHFKRFYQRTALTAEQQTIVKQISYLTLVPDQTQKISLSEFCQEFALKDMYPYERKVSVENAEISMYSAFPLDGEQFEHILENLIKTNASFKRAFSSLMDSEMHKVNIFIAKSKSSYEIFNYLLLETATSNGGSLNYFTPPILNGGRLDYTSPPSITVYQSESGRIHNLEHEYNHALFDFYINFRGYEFKELLVRYNFDWLNEGLSYVLDPNYSGRGNCKRYLTRHQFPAIESIITALNQDYTVSYIFTEYLLRQKKPVLVEILTNIKDKKSQLLESCLKKLPSLETEFLADLQKYWSLRETMVFAEDGVKYDVKIRIDQILRELHSSQTDDRWRDLAGTLGDLSRHGDDVDYNVLKDTLENVFHSISHTKITTRAQFNAFENWIKLASDGSIPISLQENPSHLKAYLSQLYAVLTSSNLEIQGGVDDSASALFYYGFFEKLSNSAYTELKQKVEDVIQATFKKCENSAGRKYYHFIKQALGSYEKLIQSVKDTPYEEQVLNLLKNQFKAFYRQTKLTVKQQITIKQLSYIILTSAQHKNAPLVEFCQKFTFRDMYSFHKEMSIGNIDVSIYSALPLDSEQSEHIRTTFERINLRFKAVLQDTMTSKTNHKVNLLIAGDEDSYVTYHYPLLRASAHDSTLEFLQKPTAGIYAIGNKLLHVEEGIGQLLYDAYIGSPIEEYGEYKFKWLSEGLSRLLIFSRSNEESEILAKLADKRLPNVEKIIKGTDQNYEFSFALTYYLYKKHNQTLDKILLYGKTGRRNLLQQELEALTSLDTDFHVFWNSRLEENRAKMLEIQRLQKQLSGIQQKETQRVKKYLQDSQNLEDKRMAIYEQQRELANQLQENWAETTRNQLTQELNKLYLEGNQLETQQTELAQRATQEKKNYEVEKKILQDQLQLLQYQKTIRRRPITSHVATTNAEKNRTVQQWTPSSNIEVSTLTTSIQQKPAIGNEERISAKAWKTVKVIAGISAGVSCTVLATFLGILIFRKKSVKNKTRNSRKPFIRNLENQRPLLSSKQINSQGFHQKNMHSSQRYDKTRLIAR